MRYIVFSLFILALTLPCAFAESVRGYTRANGTYVAPYQRSNSNSTVMDNYSHQGNSNPFTGSQGSNYDRQSPSSNYFGTQPAPSNSGSWGSTDNNN